eukprot:CAMPEP_0174263082 /NCGR_PEP_ID=MMETSP0439-20130205/17092_1 /TAXON_ID=0 /ORGANISM="Stereomyxa ramosa, Strain Chinc5" /LENGTH=316 /DNA_ID=CAMNT_0015348221 /DNA_START=36 /DNA_END=986 /DNA_ORIENTATION=+
MVGWNEEKIHDTTAFVLGTGGLGNTVALALCRLGIKKMFLLDMDVVDPSNLNRQILFTKEDIGLKKVDAAKDRLEKGHNLRTEIVAVHLNAVTGWAKVVEIAKECTVLFNCIDYGSMFDFTVDKLSEKLQIPYILGSSYANTMIVNYFPGKDGPTWCGFNNVSEAFTSNANTKEDIVKWLESKGKEADSVLTQEDLVLFHKEQMDMHDADQLILDALTAAGKSSGITADEYKDWVNHLREGVCSKITPDTVMELEDLGFIPKDLHYPTRFVGSWVCVCSGAALMMVNAWAQGVNGVKFPNYSNITLSNFEAISFGE